MKTPSLPRRLAAEAVGSALLLATVVGSGIMGERLSGGNAGLTLLANALATGAMLAVLILVFGPVSGAHFNPLVTLLVGPRRDFLAYAAAQTAGAFAGVAAAHAMFGAPLYFASTHVREGPAQWFSEAVATFGLLAVIIGCSRHRPSAVPYAVAAYITAAYWFTSSTSFANPAVTLARSATDTFSGIRPVDVFPFVLSQIAGASVAALFFRWLLPEETPA